MAEILIGSYPLAVVHWLYARWPAWVLAAFLVAGLRAAREA